LKPTKLRLFCLPLAASEGEAAGAASSPSQKISYITGKRQIMFVDCCQA
jgi:hypothetical protein